MRLCELGSSGGLPGIDYHENLIRYPQGEGRGHFTQALAMWEMLLHRRHEVVAAIAGINGKRSCRNMSKMPSACRCNPQPAPDSTSRRSGAFRSWIRCSRGRAEVAAGSSRQTLNLIDETVARTKPDLIINFLEAATGIGKLLGRIKTPVLVLGHQFMMGHPAFIRSRHSPTQQIGFRNFVRVVGSRSSKLALSFYSAGKSAVQKIVCLPADSAPPAL